MFQSQPKSMQIGWTKTSRSFPKRFRRMPCLSVRVEAQEVGSEENGWRKCQKLRLRRSHRRCRHLRPPEPVYPDNLPRSKKPLKLKEKVPHFGSVSEADELFASVPEREPGDTALDSEV